MRDINFNYAATSAKKPETSINAMVKYISANNFASPSRGGGGSLGEGRILLEARMSFMKLFNVKRPEQIVFTFNATTALNMVINGAVKKGCHVITTQAEHNAVARPLKQLEQAGIIELTILPCEKGSHISPRDFENSIQPNTKLMVMTHASNVTGAIFAYDEIAKIAKAHNILFVLDAAQTAGLVNIDFDNSDIGALVFTGHKSLMGPPGTGGIILKREAADIIEPVITGGTGSMSHLLTQPDFLPDKFEPGTPNTLGILGLKESVDFILEKGVDNIFDHEIKLTRLFMDSIAHEKITVYGPAPEKSRVPVVSFNIDNMDNGTLGEILYDKYGISTRSGLHCSPLVHQAIGTHPYGALRASFGFFTTEEEIIYGAEAVIQIAENSR